MYAQAEDFSERQFSDDSYSQLQGKEMKSNAFFGKKSKEKKSNYLKSLVLNSFYLVKNKYILKVEVGLAKQCGSMFGCSNYVFVM